MSFPKEPPGWLNFPPDARAAVYAQQQSGTCPSQHKCVDHVPEEHQEQRAFAGPDLDEHQCPSDYSG
jgi:hypothetical protein